MSQSKLQRYDMRKDAARLSRIAVPYCRFPHPGVVKRLGGAVFSVVRNSSRRTELGKQNGRRVMYDDNTTPRWALLWSHGIEITGHPRRWTFAHVWNESKDPGGYTHVANLVMTPECFGSLADKDGPLVACFRYHAAAVYGWRPVGRVAVERPAGYEDLAWTYLAPHPDPRGFIRERLFNLNNKRVQALRELSTAHAEAGL